MLLHARGWQSIYLNKDLSAGLAPESYEAYVTQRRRWAQGTFQVMLTRGGLFLRGLSFMQRINYLATLWYWLYGFPRLVYLIAPLLFLLGGLQPLIVRNLEDLLTFYLPHLAISIVGFQLVNKGMRRIFWSDVYESSISAQVALTTLLFPLRSRSIRFKVTPKGRGSQDQAAATTAMPMTILTALLIAGLIIGLSRLAGMTADSGGSGTLINTIWTGYNLVVLAMGLLLLRQRRLQRKAIRLPRRVSAVLHWNGTRLEARTLNLSETGVALDLDSAHHLPENLDVTLYPRDGEPLTLRARLARCDISGEGRISVALDFVARSEAQHRRLVELMFTAPDAWAGRHGRTMGAPEHLGRILRSLTAIFARERRLRRMAPRFRCQLAASSEAGGGQGLNLTVMDISERGASLRLPSRAMVPSPEKFRLRITWNETEVTTFSARIRNVRQGAQGSRLLGVVFTDLTREQQHDLRKHLYAVPSQDKSLATSRS